MNNKGAFQRLLIPLFITFIILLASSLPAQAASREGAPTAYIMLVDKLSINDIDPAVTPSIYKLTQKGAIGLASNRTLKSHNTIDCSLTLGAGNLGRGYLNDLMGFNQDEMVPDREKTAGQLYKTLMGINGDSSALLLVNLPEILAGMTEESVNTVPGALGEILRTNNLKVCVFGNGDSGIAKLRAGIAVGMDARGQVPLGDVGPATYQLAPESYLGLETDNSYISQQIDRYRSQADLIIVDLSDLARLETADIALPLVTKTERKQRLGKIDQIIASVSQQLDPQKDLLLVVGISPSAVALEQKGTFTPVLAYGKGFTPGILSSTTSRRDFVVANTDVAPTVLKFFNLADKDRVMIGQAMTTQTAGEVNNLQAAKDLDASASTANRLRTPLIKGYVVLQIIVILLALGFIFWGRHVARIMKPLIMAMVVIPLVLLPLNKIPLANDWGYIILAILLTILLTTLVLYVCKGNGINGFVLVSLLTVLCINLDVIIGTPLIQSSVLGYDPMSGARYYGIGNEYMGILVGSSIAISVALYEKYKNRWLLAIIAVFFISQCYLIAGPALGANSDGMLTAPAAFLVTFLLLREIKMNPRIIFGLISVVAVIAAAATFYDMSRSVELQSHIGRAANQIAAGGWQQILLIIKRKMGMNLKLIRYTIWSYVFIVMLLMLSLLVFRPVGAMRQLRQEHPYILKGFAGIITGAVIGLLVNDSGIVVASTTSIYLVVPLLLLMLNIDGDGSENLLAKEPQSAEPVSLK